MDEQRQGNSDMEQVDVFTVVNNYFLLFFCGSCVLSSMYIQQLFQMVGQYRVGISVSSLAGIILPVWFVTRRFAPGFRRQIRLQAPRPARLAHVLLATLAVIVIVDQIYLITQQLVPVPETYADSIRELRPTGFWTFAITFVGISALVPIAEELVFRGVIQQIFSRNMGPVAGFVLAGVIFGAVHLNAHLLFSVCFFGVFLGFVYFATGNLVYTILAHSLFNTVALLQLTFSPPELSGEPPFYLRDTWMFVAALVLLVFFLLKIRKGGPETEPPYREQETDLTLE